MRNLELMLGRWNKLKNGKMEYSRLLEATLTTLAEGWLVPVYCSLAAVTPLRPRNHTIDSDGIVILNVTIHIRVSSVLSS